jgi:hypothetical protein
MTNDYFTLLFPGTRDMCLLWQSATDHALWCAQLPSGGSLTGVATKKLLVPGFPATAKLIAVGQDPEVSQRLWLIVQDSDAAIYSQLFLIVASDQTTLQLEGSGWQGVPRPEGSG